MGVVYAEFSQRLEAIREFLELSPELPQLQLDACTFVSNPDDFVEGHYLTASNERMPELKREPYLKRLETYVQHCKGSDRCRANMS